MKNAQNKKNSVLYPTATILIALLLSILGTVQALQLKNVPLISDPQYKVGNQPAAKDSVYNIVEKMPQFPGGEKEIIKFLNQTMHYPDGALKNGEHGKVIVQFIVSKTGKVGSTKILRGASKALNDEAFRVVGLLPNWIPGEEGGEKVSVYMVVPVLFNNNPTKNDTANWVVNEKTLIVIDTLVMPSNLNLSILNREKIDSVYLLKPFPEETKKKLIEQYGQKAENGVILVKTKKKGAYEFTDSNTCMPGDENYIYKDVEKMPKFPGGDYKLVNYIARTLQYPAIAQEKKIQGKVIVRFVIDKTGRVKNAKVIKGLDASLNNESIRVINTLPKFVPGEKDGKKVNVYYILPIAFRLEGEEFSNSGNEKSIIICDGQRMPVGFNLELVDLGNLKFYKAIKPETKVIKKQLIEQYGADGANGVILISSNK